MNNVGLVGRLTSKPQLNYTTSNVAYTRFTVAVNRAFSNAQGERETDFINVRAWRKQAENVCMYLDKGSLVSVEGRLQTGGYTDKDGNKRNYTEVVAGNVQFLSSKKSEEKPKEETTDPFKDFGEQIDIYDNSYID